MSVTSIARGVIISLGLGSLLPVPVHAEDFARGQELYEHHCNSCHHNLAFGREDREITSPSELRKRVVAWATHTGLDWGDSEIGDVIHYLDRSFYHFKDKDT